ncbi:hypothetical protein SAMN05421811_102477 [Nonomuraea wenchangensis]|uniref:Uncharacterized protein n=2 Tax=Nonomuraea wenchangensis TaxID=568860 RepID=A0A1I0CVS5_9ACTN|nr:hypothetical protein SAMN05421811_102477 [Nonomuraea wenchangensis]
MVRRHDGCDHRFMSESLDPYTLVTHLRSLPDEWLTHLLRQVFEARTPEDAPGSRYFLAVATRERDPRTGRWAGPPGYTAVAYPDAAHYGGDRRDVDWGLVQSGGCARCRVSLAGSRKRVRCPICDEPAYLT